MAAATSAIVVDFDFDAQEVTTVHHGTITYQLDDPVRLMVRWRDVMRAAPEELSSTLVLMPLLSLRAAAAAQLLLVYAGLPGTEASVADGGHQLLLELGTVTEATITEVPYAEVMEEDAQHPPGIRTVARNTLVPRLAGDVLTAVDAAAPGSRTDGVRDAEPGRCVRPRVRRTPPRSRTATLRR